MMAVTVALAFWLSFKYLCVPWGEVRSQCILHLSLSVCVCVCVCVLCVVCVCGVYVIVCVVYVCGVCVCNYYSTSVIIPCMLQQG